MTRERWASVTVGLWGSLPWWVAHFLGVPALSREYWGVVFLCALMAAWGQYGASLKE